MIIYNIKNELNKTFLSTGQEMAQYDDYRYKMISDNKIDGILNLEIRNINGEPRLYFDISGKENFAKYVSVRNLDIDDLLNLTECMMHASEKMREYLLEETCLVFEPDLIFRNLKDGKFEFVCIPGHIRDENDAREDIMELMQLIISHVAAENETAVEAAYALYETAAKGTVFSKEMYETVWEHSKKNTAIQAPEIIAEEEDYPESFYEPVENGPLHVRYHSSFKEWLAVGFAASGVICLGLGAYLSMIHQ